jgi:hypothetical protein
MIVKTLLFLYGALFAVSLFLDHGPRAVLH